ncbi:hypothetical protein ACJX0J_002981 (mitochondrion) [Zea mays]
MILMILIGFLPHFYQNDLVALYPTSQWDEALISKEKSGVFSSQGFLPFRVRVIHSRLFAKNAGYQMGYIKLACPVTHVWYLKGLSYAKKPTFLRLRGLFEDEIASCNHSISPFFSTPGFLLIGGFGFANYFIIENSVGYSGDEWEGMAGTSISFWRASLIQDSL